MRCSDTWHEPRRDGVLVRPASAARLKVVVGHWSTGSTGQMRPTDQRRIWRFSKFYSCCISAARISSWCLGSSLAPAQVTWKTSVAV